MTSVSITTAIRALTSITATMLGLGIAGCSLAPVPASAGQQARLAAPARKPSVLAVLLDAASASDVAMLRNMIIATARPGEHLVVISSTDGAVLGSFTAPRPPIIEMPGLPAAPKDATSFQTANYRRDLSSHTALLRHDEAALGLRERHELEAWADRSAAQVTSAIRRQPTAPHNRLAAAIDTAVTTIADLQQSGVPSGTRRTIAILGIDGVPGSPPALHASLAGTTVVLAGFPNGKGDGAAWQADLLQADADRAVVLTQATDSQLPTLVDQGLDGTVSYRLAHINYGPAQYRLPTTAKRALRKVLYLLIVRYSGATATIDGYTDDIPAPGGNMELSWKRASAVMAWLVRHGVAPTRLQAVGHGTADPVAPNRPGGQPLDRRVVVIIEPAA
jgi:outer membrane protein OmpA-like peptidoglycan-associated protein